jgi:hypothetical protein
MSLGPGIPSRPEALSVALEEHRHQLPQSQQVWARLVLGGLHHDYVLVPVAARVQKILAEDRCAEPGRARRGRRGNAEWNPRKPTSVTKAMIRIGAPSRPIAGPGFHRGGRATLPTDRPKASGISPCPRRLALGEARSGSAPGTGPSMGSPARAVSAARRGA